MLDELKYSFKNVSAYGSEVTVSRYNHVHQIAIWLMDSVKVH